MNVALQPLDATQQGAGGRGGRLMLAHPAREVFEQLDRIARVLG
ncbi:MAG TPA: hypothetical protein VIX73_32140 [Kofleriaceae bacterium]